LKLLAIDTATEACSAALYIDGDIQEKYEIAPRKHAELILGMVDGLLNEADLKLKSLDGLCFGRGPGAFTGVRIATGIIQGLAFASELSVVPISTLAAMAQGATSEAKTILSAIDARMNEVYCALYSVGEDGVVKPLCEEQVIKPENIELEITEKCFGVGTGWGTYEEELSMKVGDKLQGFKSEYYPRASNILTLAKKEFELGNTVTASEALPIYLRNKVTG
jgi:tRNA threonylcarbamoyladenosine biosynthesis protein TsaB